MYMKVLGEHVVDLANSPLELLADNIAQRHGVLRLTLPFRIQLIRDLSKHKKLRDLSKPFLRPEQFESDEQFLAELK